jgi:hypothetical protein
MPTYDTTDAPVGHLDALPAAEMEERESLAIARLLHEARLQG